jgi:hypothetical protein
VQLAGAKTMGNIDNVVLTPLFGLAAIQPNQSFCHTYQPALASDGERLMIRIQGAGTYT